MNKFFVCIIAFFALIRVSYAQNNFAKGDKLISASLGFINTIHNGSSWETIFPPISLTGEYGIVDGLINNKASIGIGTDFGYTASKYINEVKTVYKYSNIILGLRGAFHYQFVDNLDTYAGLAFGYNIVSGNGNYAVSKFFTDPCVGARYYLTNHFAAMAEIAYDISLIRIGVAYKF
jgi:hypothetical protein